MTTGGRVEIIHFEGAEALAAAAARRWFDPLRPAHRNVALSGGRIGRGFLTAAAELAANDPSVARRIQETHFYWADERCVPPDHVESNYRIALEALFERVSVPSSSIHRVRGELDPDEAVEMANQELARVLGSRRGAVPALDLVFLGMGEDGHVASLFPEATPASATLEDAYCLVVGPKPPNPRITLSYRALAAASEAWVLVAGENKQGVLRNSLEGRSLTPLARLIKLRESIVILVDRFF